MKKLLLLFIISCFAGKAICHVSRKELKAAKDKYVSDSVELESLKRTKWVYKYACREDRSKEDNAYWCSNVISESALDDLICDRQSLVEIERLTYEGFKAIRHDQAIPFFLRKYN